MKEMSPFRLAQLPFDLDDLSLSPNDVYQLMTPKHAPRPALLDEDSGLGMDSFDVSQSTCKEIHKYWNILCKVTHNPWRK